METAEVIGGNLFRLRKAKRFTQEQLAEAAGLSRPAYRALEKGRSTPRPENLRALARSLEVPLRELVIATPTLRRVRFRSLKRLKSRDQVLAEVGNKLRDFRELEDMLGEAPGHGLEALWRLVERHRSEGLPGLAGAVRADFGLSPREPVHDVCGLLESRKIKVFSVEVATDAFLGLSVAEEDGGPAVVANTWGRLAVEHWIFSAAHELGHLLLHLGAYDVSVQDEDEAQEEEANLFASHFLMPEEAFRREWQETAGLSLLDRVLKVKRVFRVSWRTVVYRAVEGLPEEQRGRVWQRIAFEYRDRTGRTLLKLEEPQGVGSDAYRDPRRDRGGGVEPASLERHDFQGDRLPRLVRQAVEGGVISLSRGAEILGLTANEMRDLAASWVA